MSTLPKLIISTRSLPSTPSGERPSGCSDLVWRYSINPKIKRKQSKNENSIFDSTVVPFNGGFTGVFRVDERAREMNLRRGFSKDGVNWKIDDKPITFIQQTRKTLEDKYKYKYKYVPRVVFIKTGTGSSGVMVITAQQYELDRPTILKTFYQLENAFMPCNRNGVLFPRKINGKFAMRSRSSDTGHTSFGDIFYSEGPDMIHRRGTPFREGTRLQFMAIVQDWHEAYSHRNERGMVIYSPRSATFVQWRCFQLRCG